MKDGEYIIDDFFAPLQKLADELQEEPNGYSMETIQSKSQWKSGG